MGLFDDVLSKKSNNAPVATKQQNGRLFGDVLSNSAPLTKNASASGSLFQNLPPKYDLSTYLGLNQLAERANLSAEARKLSKQGEDPNKRFSGGIFRDIFDVIDIPQAQIIGAIKGISPKQAYQERQSFRDVLPNTTAGKVAGTVADIFIDPLNLLGVGFISKTSKVAGVTSKAEKFLEAGKVVSTGKKITAGELALSGIKQGVSKITPDFIKQPLGKTLVYRFGQDPIYANLAEKATRDIALGAQNAVELSKPIINLSKDQQLLVSAARKSGDLSLLPESLRNAAKPAFDELDRLGKRAVNLGLLDAKTYDENVGKYMARLYASKELPDAKKAIKGLFDSKPIRTNLDRFKTRQDAFGVVYQPSSFKQSITKKFTSSVERDDFVKSLNDEVKVLQKFDPIPDDVREAMGEILEAGYPTAKSLVNLSQAVERTSFFNQVANKWAKNTLEEGFEKLPETKTLGLLSGKAVPKPIYDDIQEIIRVKSPLEKALNTAVGGFKFGKVVLNPSTHARNVMSNFILNDFEGLSPARLDIYGKAAKELATKGKMYQEARKAGLGLDTYAASELKDILLSEMKTGNRVVKGVQKSMNKVADIYQKEEEFAKMAAYIYRRGQGLSPENAYKAAERATFNYAQVTPFIRRIRESVFGVPFLTFTYKVTPQVAKTLVSNPTKISSLGKIARGVESLSDQKELAEEKAVQPDYFKNNFFIKLPTKDKFGRSIYFDLTYIIPFGDLITGGMFDGRVDRETGLPENLLLTLGRNNPLTDTILSLAKNQDFFGREIYKSSDNSAKQGADILAFLGKQYSPSVLESSISALTDDKARQEQGAKAFLPFRLGQSMQFQKTAQEGEIPSSSVETKTVPQELLRALIGLKQQPFSIEKQTNQREYDKIKRLNTLLKDRGLLKEFTRSYIPKK